MFKVSVTGFIGLPVEGVSRKKFDSFTKETDSLESSRFATFEITFDEIEDFESQDFIDQ